MIDVPATGAGRASPQLSVGILTADLTRLGEELSILHGSGCWAHVDVMDGAFCPQLTVGPPVLAAVAAAGLPVDAHLMVEEPIRILPEIVAAGPAVVTVHAESTRHLHRTLQELTALADRQGRQILRGVGISPGKAQIASWGIDVIVSGRAIYDGTDPAGNLRRMLEQIRSVPASGRIAAAVS